MNFSGEFNGCRIFIRGMKDQEIGTTTVVDYNREHMTVTVRGTFYNAEDSGFVVVLILANDSVYEYNGKLRRSTLYPANSEIALSHGQLLEHRGAKRFPVNAPATVDHLVVDNRLFPLLTPIEVTLVNLSATGVLIRTVPNCFVNGSSFRFTLHSGETRTTMQGQVVRVREAAPAVTEYGCKLLANE